MRLLDTVQQIKSLLTVFAKFYQSIISQAPQCRRMQPFYSGVSRRFSPAPPLSSMMIGEAVLPGCARYFGTDEAAQMLAESVIMTPRAVSDTITSKRFRS